MDDTLTPSMPGGVARRRAVLLAVLALGVAATPAQAARRGSSSDWRYVRECRSAACYAKHPDGWRTVPHEGRGRQRWLTPG